MVIGTINNEVERLITFKMAEYKMLVVNILFLELLILNLLVAIIELRGEAASI